MLYASLLLKESKLLYREKVYPKVCMNRIILIIGYMNVIYALKKLGDHFYPATSSSILNSYICILCDMCRLEPWSGHSKVISLYYDSLRKGLIMQARIKDIILEDTLHCRVFVLLFCFAFCSFNYFL